MTNSTIKADVAIIGAGSAGVAAAVGAASSGAEVVLVEKQCYPGGNATAAMVGTVCGLFFTHAGEEPRWVAGGFLREFAEDLMEHSQSKPHKFYDRLHVLPYQINSFRIVCNRLLVKHKIRCLWHTTIKEVQIAEGKINQLLVFDGAQTIHLLADQVIDCTGDSWVSRLAGDDWTIGGENQAAARVFKLCGLEEIPADAIHFTLSLALRRGVGQGKIEKENALLSVVPGSYTGDCAYFKWPLREKISDDPDQRVRLLKRSEQQIKAVVAFLKENAAAFSNAELVEIAPEVGFRTGRRPIGKAVLTKSMVVEAQHIADGIANGAWPIEYWKPGEQVEMQFLAEGAYYQIPAGCLESARAKNLYFAGRNLSAEPRALASARVMGICLQTGYAAGILAAGAASGIPHGESIQRVRRELEIEQ